MPDPATPVHGHHRTGRGRSPVPRESHEHKPEENGHAKTDLNDQYAVSDQNDASGPLPATVARYRPILTQETEKPGFPGLSSKADDGSRTRDLRLGKPTLYQLSYVRARSF